MNKRQDPSARSQAGAMAAKLGALAHPARIAILREIACREACCCKDVVSRLDLAQSTVSQHLKVLVEAGLVRFTTDRRRSRYEVDRDALAGLSAALDDLVASCCEPVGSCGAQVGPEGEARRV